MDFTVYTKEIRDKMPKATEITYRADLADLLNAYIVESNLAKQVKIFHDPKKTLTPQKRPDFRVEKEGLILGYIETKPLDFDVVDLLKTKKGSEYKQIQTYLKLNSNLIFTNYKTFILFRGKRAIISVDLLEITNKHVTIANSAGVENIFSIFFAASTEVISDSRILAGLLAERTKLYRSHLEQVFGKNIGKIAKDMEAGDIKGTGEEEAGGTEEEQSEETEEEETEGTEDEEAEGMEKEDAIPKGESEEEEVLELREDEHGFLSRLEGLYNQLKNTVIEKLSIDEFIDAYVQTVVYSLFIARLQSGVVLLDPDNIVSFIPKQYPLLQEFFQAADVSTTPDSVEWILREILDVLNRTNIDDIKNSLFTSPSGGGEDPFIHFYEPFLANYDNMKKKSRGVFYTPLPVVQFIIKSLEEILLADFHVEGFQEPSVRVLDFATGTGTFLLATFTNALNKIPVTMKHGYIKTHLLRNFVGFECLIAPYAIAHLRLASFLMQQEGYEFNQDERLQVYLTDTLDDKELANVKLANFLTNEGQEANKVKLQDEILVIMGNPPYNVRSKNKKPFIMQLLKSYKEGLSEKNIQQLNDDYIKFIRFAEWKIVENNEKNKRKAKGVIGIITNNSFLKAPTHWRMRQHLFQSFDKIYILNLHGNYRIDPDENIFAIKEVGVCILFFIKLEQPLPKKEVKYYSTLENGLVTRDAKYNFLQNNIFSTISWVKLNPSTPKFKFVPITATKDIEETYSTYWSLEDIFKERGSATETGNDTFFVAHAKDDALLINRVRDALTNPDEDLVQAKYNLKSVAGGWRFGEFRKCKFNKKYITPYLYRPFDLREVYFDPKALERARYPKRGVVVKNPGSTTKSGKTGSTTSSGKAKTKRGVETDKNINVFLIDCSSASASPLTGNLAIVTVRQFAENVLFNHVFVTDKVCDVRVMTSNRGKGYIFPLLSPQSKQLTLFDVNPAGPTNVPSSASTTVKSDKITNPGQELKSPFKSPNFTPEFNAFISKKYSPVPEPQEIFAYIYGIMHSMIYRTKYNEFLKEDFPRVPFPPDLPQFMTIAKLGQKILDAHLLKCPPLSGVSVEGVNPSPDHAMTIDKSKIHYDEPYSRVYINDSQYITGISKPVWDFQLGGYHVVEKWLQDRNKRDLEDADVFVFGRIVGALTLTISCMTEIDANVGTLLD